MFGFGVLFFKKRHATYFFGKVRSKTIGGKRWSRTHIAFDRYRYRLVFFLMLSSIAGYRLIREKTFFLRQIRRRHKSRFPSFSLWEHKHSQFKKIKSSPPGGEAGGKRGRIGGFVIVWRGEGLFDGGGGDSETSSLSFLWGNPSFSSVRQCNGKRPVSRFTFDRVMFHLAGDTAGSKSQSMVLNFVPVYSTSVF